MIPTCPTLFSLLILKLSFWPSPPFFLATVHFRPRMVSHLPSDTDTLRSSGTRTLSSLVCDRLFAEKKQAVRIWTLRIERHVLFSVFLSNRLGGANEYTDYRDDVIMFSLQTRTWSRPEIRGEVPARYLHSATVYRNKMYVYGGFAKNSKCKFLRPGYLWSCFLIHAIARWVSQ